MSDMMVFPKTVEEFMEMYKMVDTDEVYSNGTEYVPIYRMKQWFEHQRASNAHPTHECVKPTHECISREDAMMEARPEYLNPNQKGHEEYNKAWNDGVEAYWNGLKELPSEPVGNTEQLDRICAKCKHYTKEQLCVWWSYFGFGPEDYCSRWEERA